jgi:hypothetical protein
MSSKAAKELPSPPSSPLEHRSRNPASRDLYLLLTARKPISNHDARTAKGGSNATLFNRRTKLLPSPISTTRIDQGALDAFCGAHTLPPELQPLFAEEPFPDFAAAAYIRLFLDAYNSAEGEGVFIGAERHDRLGDRIGKAASMSRNLRGFWDALTRLMKVGLQRGRYDADLLRFWSLPSGVQFLIRRALLLQPQSIETLARVWHSDAKRYSPEYVARSGSSLLVDRAEIAYEADALPSDPIGLIPILLPEIADNTLRHCLIREAAMFHLFTNLGIQAGIPGFGELPPGVEALFDNGSNIKAGSAEASGAFVAYHALRDRYPVLDLLPGCVDAGMIGESPLKLSSWLVCSENAAALAETPAAYPAGLGVSAFDMIEEITETRQESPHGVGQMIHSFETLVAGAQSLVRLHLQPYTADLTAGALLTALDYFECHLGTIAGASSRGYGNIALTYLNLEAWTDAQTLRADYLAYLENHRTALRQGLLDGTFGTGKILCS